MRCHLFEAQQDVGKPYIEEQVRKIRLLFYTPLLFLCHFSIRGILNALSRNSTSVILVAYCSFCRAPLGL